MTATQTIPNGTSIAPDMFRQKIIANAIDSENEAFAFYTGAATVARDLATKTLFESFASDELRYRDFLECCMMADQRAMQVERLNDYKVTDMLMTPQLSPEMKPLDGVVLAIKRKRETMMMYITLASESRDAGQKELFMNLSVIAQSHKSRLEDIYTNMAFPEVW